MKGIKVYLSNQTGKPVIQLECKYIKKTPTPIICYFNYIAT